MSETEQIKELRQQRNAAILAAWKRESLSVESGEKSKSVVITQIAAAHGITYTQCINILKQQNQL